MSKYKVTISGSGFSYTVVIEAEEKATMKEFGDQARKKIKEQYGVDIPADTPIDIEFEMVG